MTNCHPRDQYWDRIIDTETRDRAAYEAEPSKENHDRVRFWDAFWEEERAYWATVTTAAATG